MIKKIASLIYRRVIKYNISKALGWDERLKKARQRYSTERSEENLKLVRICESRLGLPAYQLKTKRKEFTTEQSFVVEVSRRYQPGTLRVNLNGNPLKFEKDYTAQNVGPRSIKVTFKAEGFFTFLASWDEWV